MSFSWRRLSAASHLPLSPSVPRSQGGKDDEGTGYQLADLALTSHALTRMYSRRFSERAVHAALQHGREVHGRGAVIFAIGRKEVMHARTSGIDLTGYEGIHVVCSREGTIMTVYRNRDLRDLRPRKRSRSYRYRLTIQQKGI